MRAPTVLLGLLAFAASARAQETTGNIRGRLRTKSGAAVAAARVTVSGPELLGVRIAASGQDGSFMLPALPPGTYTVRIAAIGYRPVAVQGVRIQLGGTTGLDQSLEAAAVQLGELTITASTSRLDPAHTDIAAILSSEDYAALPSERDHTSLVTILPHANRSYRGDPVNVAGSTGLENMYFIDGVNVTTPYRADGGTRLPYNFVRSVEVKSGGYEAQYGRALGAVINAITYSGTNHFEANVFGFFTHDALASKPRAEPVLRETSSLTYDVGIRMGGPVLLDKLWYSAAYNPRVERATRTVLGLGSFDDERTTHILAGKLTWQPTSSVNLEFSLFGDPSTQNAVRAPTGWFPAGFAPLEAGPYRVRFESGGIAGSLRSGVTLGRKLLLEASVSRQRGRLATEGASPDPLYVDYVTSTVGGGWPERDDSHVGRWALTLRGTVTLGAHSVIGGAEYEDVSNWGVGGQGDFARVDTDLWIGNFGTFPGNFHNHNPTVYVQDGWRVSDGLTLNAGVRWSRQTLTGARGLTAQRFEGELQPRVGFVWQPGERGRQRVFGSLGRFYQQTPLWASGGWGDYEFVTRYYSQDPRQSGVLPDSSKGGPVTFDPTAPDLANVPNLSVEHYDEATLGYERMLGSAGKVTARLIRRELRSSFQLGYDFVRGGISIIGTPGEGAFDFLPAPKREYTALELSAEGSWRRLSYRGSYVLSRNWGNYSGLFDADLGVATPSINRTFNSNNHAVNSTGLLPNDRTHVLKLSGSYQTHLGLRTGFVFSWSSGTPLNAFAPCPCDFPVFRTFVVPRGTVGRTPSIWVLDLRLAHQLPIRGSARSRVMLDVLNLGNKQSPVWLEEQRYTLNTNGVPSGENPGYLQPVAFQPPRMAKLGFEITF